MCSSDLLDATLTNGAVELGDLKVKDLNTGEIVTTLPWMSLQALDFNLRQRNLHVSKIRIARYTKIVRIEKDGALNLNLLMEPLPAKPVSTNTASAIPSAPWNLAVDDFVLNDGAISFTDLSRHSRFETTLSPIRFHMQIGRAHV